MPDISTLLQRRARESGVRLDILEKDYALSYLLKAIAEEPSLGKVLVLKGGTALRKCYFADYRFSEDLDFSTHPHGALPDLTRKMSEALQRLRQLLEQRGPFHVQMEPLILREPHPFEQAAFLVRVQFPTHRQPLCRLKVEITVDEPLLLPPARRELIHDYDESLVADIAVYQIAEIVAEKLRALLQSKARLAERGWGASRVCRDYYDLWAIFQREQLQEAIPPLVKQKCAVRNLTFDTVADFFAEPLLQIARAEWDAQLSPFIVNAPAPEQVLAELENRVQQLWG